MRRLWVFVGSLAIGVALILGVGGVAVASPGTWQQLGSDIDGEAAANQTGASVAMSADGSTVIVGGRLHDGNGSNAGNARIFDWDGTNWAQRGADIDGEAAGDEAGLSVAMSADSNTVIVGARRNDGNGSNAGHARVFDWDGTNWVQRGADIDGEAAGDLSGLSLSMSADGNAVIIGAFGNNGSTGHARVFDWDGTNWTQRGVDIEGEAAGDEAGLSVAMSADGSTVIVGAAQNDGNGSNAGHARVFDWDGTNWTQRGVDIDGEAAGDLAGRPVAMSANGNTIVVGARLNDGNGSNAGQARVFDWDGTNWTQRGVDIDGEAAGDEAAFAVAMSTDGNTVVVGAAQNDGNGSSAGHARIFDWDGTNWAQRGADIDGEAAGDQSGLSVDMSADGNTVIIGANLNDGNGSDAGHARVHHYIPIPVPDVVGLAQATAESDITTAGLTVGTISNAFSSTVPAGNVISQSPAAGTNALPGQPVDLVISDGPEEEVLSCAGVTGTESELEALGYNVIIGTDGRDFLNGTSGRDFILGLAGRDAVFSYGGADVVCSGSGNDTVISGGGDDLVDLGRGNDFLAAGNGDDTAYGQSGRDNMSGNGGNDILRGGDNRDRLFGSSGDDVLFGEEGHDRLRGGTGADNLVGDAGNDNLVGDGGDDTLSGGIGDDVLRGLRGFDNCDGGPSGAAGDTAFTCEITSNIP